MIRIHLGVRRSPAHPHSICRIISLLGISVSISVSSSVHRAAISNTVICGTQSLTQPGRPLLNRLTRFFWSQTSGFYNINRRHSKFLQADPLKDLSLLAPKLGQAFPLDRAVLVETSRPESSLEMTVGYFRFEPSYSFVCGLDCNAW